jgi:hypothetical protein
MLPSEIVSKQEVLSLSQNTMFIPNGIPSSNKELETFIHSLNGIKTFKELSQEENGKSISTVSNLSVANHPIPSKRFWELVKQNVEQLLFVDNLPFPDPKFTWVCDNITGNYLEENGLGLFLEYVAIPKSTIPINNTERESKKQSRIRSSEVNQSASQNIIVESLSENNSYAHINYTLGELEDIPPITYCINTDLLWNTADLSDTSLLYEEEEDNDDPLPVLERTTNNLPPAVFTLHDSNKQDLITSQSIRDKNTSSRSFQLFDSFPAYTQENSTHSRIIPIIKEFISLEVSLQVPSQVQSPVDEIMQQDSDVYRLHFQIGNKRKIILTYSAQEFQHLISQTNHTSSSHKDNLFINVKQLWEEGISLELQTNYCECTEQVAIPKNISYEISSLLVQQELVAEQLKVLITTKPPSWLQSPIGIVTYTQDIPFESSIMQRLISPDGVELLTNFGILNFTFKYPVPITNSSVQQQFNLGIRRWKILHILLHFRLQMQLLKSGIGQVLVIVNINDISTSMVYTATMVVSEDGDIHDSEYQKLVENVLTPFYKVMDCRLVAY